MKSCLYSGVFCDFNSISRELLNFCVQSYSNPTNTFDLSYIYLELPKFTLKSQKIVDNEPESNGIGAPAIRQGPLSSFLTANIENK